MSPGGLPDDDTPVFVISIAAQLAGMHPQTLRQYDRLGLVSPGRSGGGGRRYSAREVALLREVQRLSQEEGVNLAGIKRVIELENHIEALGDRVAQLSDALARTQQALAHAGQALARTEQALAEYGGPAPGRDLVRLRDSALVVWQPHRP